MKWISTKERLPAPNYRKPVKEKGGRYNVSTYRKGNPQSERYWYDTVEFWLDESEENVLSSHVIGSAIPEWLTNKSREYAKNLWHKDKRVTAVRFIQEESRLAGYSITIKKALELLTEHCL